MLNGEETYNAAINMAVCPEKDLMFARRASAFELL